MSLTQKYKPRTPTGEACYVSIRIQDATIDREILIPRSGGLTEDWNSLGPDSPLDYVLSMTPESFTYNGSQEKIIVLDRNVVSEEEVDKIKKETGMIDNEKTNDQMDVPDITEEDTTNVVNIQVLMDDMVTEAYCRMDVLSENLVHLDNRILVLNDTIMKLQNIRNEARDMKMNLQNEKSILERSIDVDTTQEN